eukprot:Amastigsp_a841935_24.p3 type:complete len:149 gc:universal Amastigsp_a841935_24:632-186(-)
MRISSPAAAQTPSTTSSASGCTDLTTAPRAATSFKTPVEVSVCVAKTTLNFRLDKSARTSSIVGRSPICARKWVTTPPARSATRPMRSPKYPVFTTSAWSFRSMMLNAAASIASVPEPGRINGCDDLSASKTVRSMPNDAPKASMSCG